MNLHSIAKGFKYKGPWKQNITAQYLIIDANGKTVCTLDESNPYWQFNAILICERVNALDGINNPQGLRELIDAAREVLANWEGNKLASSVRYLNNSLALLDVDGVSERLPTL